MSELRSLYQEIVLDHNRQPRNFGALAAPTHRASGHNPLCGDRVEVFLRVVDGRIAEIAFEGDGCAISTASASIMTESLAGKTLAEATALFEGFRALLTGQSAADIELGQLEVLAGVRTYPARVKCATLPWHALQAALRDGAATTTE